MEEWEGKRLGIVREEREGREGEGREGKGDRG